ncbi:hypothetical protein P0082_07820 [Candidatus Haliotispira prima]|uniref:Uncharacterized protein n=1 Tax=Candidatus Haliotispira prima TaxID=3034016 RepID=A0ABY8MEP4_9SPIO|nr:hypothetical protein P0082_07820 [Candidatus Haliotispira prima]
MSTFIIAGIIAGIIAAAAGGVGLMAGHKWGLATGRKRRERALAEQQTEYETDTGLEGDTK